jgi:hypothetical protein
VVKLKTFEDKNDISYESFSQTVPVSPQRGMGNIKLHRAEAHGLPRRSVAAAHRPVVIVTAATIPVSVSAVAAGSSVKWHWAKGTDGSARDAFLPIQAASIGTRSAARGRRENASAEGEIGPERGVQTSIGRPSNRPRSPPTHVDAAVRVCCGPAVGSCNTRCSHDGSQPTQPSFHQHADATARSRRCHLPLPQMPPSAPADISATAHDRPPR